MPPTVSPAIPPNSTPDANQAECLKSRWKPLKKKDGSQVRKTHRVQPKQKSTAVTGSMRTASFNQGTYRTLASLLLKDSRGSCARSCAAICGCLRGSSQNRHHQRATQTSPNRLSATKAPRHVV